MRTPLRIGLLLLLSFALSSNVLASDKGQAAFLKSLIIPGWGQYELGRPKHALAFFSADLLFVGAALSLRNHGTQMRDEYEAFAAAHAGVRGSHGKEFYIDVGNWMNVFEYNEQRLADRSFASLYDTDSEYWMWDSDHNRAHMDQMRVTSDRSLNRVIYAVALIGVNHLVSAFHAGRLDTQSKTERANRVGWQIEPQRIRDGGQLSVRLFW